MLFLLVGLPLSCITYMRWWYPFWTERAIKTNRSYYESLVREISKDEIPPRATACYRHSEPGIPKRLSREEKEVDFYHFIKDATVVRAERKEDGSLVVRIPLYGGDLTQYGLLYFSTPVSDIVAGYEVGPEGKATRFDEHWWTYSLWLGH